MTIEFQPETLQSSHIKFCLAGKLSNSDNESHKEICSKSNLHLSSPHIRTRWLSCVVKTPNSARDLQNARKSSMDLNSSMIRLVQNSGRQMHENHKMKLGRVPPASFGDRIRYGSLEITINQKNYRRKWWIHQEMGGRSMLEGRRRSQRKRIMTKEEGSNIP